MKVSSIVKTKFELYHKIFTMMNIAYGDKFNLVNAEKNVLAALYVENDELVKSGVTDEVDRNIVLFSKPTKSRIIKQLDISYATYHNMLNNLRGKRMIDKNTVNPFFKSVVEHSMDDEFVFTIRFNPKSK